MIIRRRYHFYAAHRNTVLRDKCSRLHGHRYGVEVSIVVYPLIDGSGAGIVFAEIDQRLAPVFETYDHRTLLCYSDPLAVNNAIVGAVVLPFATSTENLAAHLLRICRDQLDGCIELALQETDSATVVARLEDLDTWPAVIA